MSETATPREVFGQLLHGILDKRWDELPECYAEDAVVTFPFTMPEPHRLVGREDVRRHFARARDLPLEFQARNVVVHDTADPEVIIAEFEYHGTVTTTGKPVRFHNIAVARVRDGRVVESRDYHDHVAIAAALDASIPPAAD